MPSHPARCCRACQASFLSPFSADLTCESGYYFIGYGALLPQPRAPHASGGLALAGDLKCFLFGEHKRAWLTAALDDSSVHNSHDQNQSPMPFTRKLMGLAMLALLSGLPVTVHFAYDEDSPEDDALDDSQLHSAAFDEDDDAMIDPADLHIDGHGFRRTVGKYSLCDQQVKFVPVGEYEQGRANDLLAEAQSLLKLETVFASYDLGGRSLNFAEVVDHIDLALKPYEKRLNGLRSLSVYGEHWSETYNGRH